MKKILLSIGFVLFTLNIFATHIIGGEMRYEYVGPGTAANSKIYKIRLLLLKGDVPNVADLISQYVVGVFNNDNNQKVKGTAANNNWLAVEDFSGKLPVPITVSPCIAETITLLYTYKTYSFNIELPANNSGYTIAFQTYSRQNSNNISNDQGATYSCVVPGINILPFTELDTSPAYQLPIAVICENSSFTLDFSATDADGDSLVYQFCNAYNGGAADQGDYQNPVGPPYGSVTYTSGYTGTSPMGSQVNINSKTGIISGIAPGAGKYVICVCASVYRKGVYIGVHRKDLIVAVNSCTKLSANPTFSPIYCGDDFTVTFTEASSGNPTTFYWNFGDPSTGTADTSTQETPQHTFSDTGVYNIKLIVSAAGQCVDSIIKQIKVYPGFKPALEIKGQCKNTAIKFNDLTTAVYGTVSNWSWTFGDPTSAQNTSTLQNPTHNYAAANTYPIHFVVGSSKGCTATIDTSILITDKPALSVTHDTLICIIDTLQLHAAGDGSFLWSPNYNINNLTIPDPLVSPDVTTTYHVQLTDPFGCVGEDSVKVRVVSVVSLSGPADTTICQTDPILIRENSDGLKFAWTPNDGSINDTTILRPTVRPLVTTTYHIIASIGKCFSEDDVKVVPIPYPKANAGPDIPLCFGYSTQLHASGGVYYSWSPTLFLSNPRIADPAVTLPTSSVRYVVSVRDTLGCPKTVTDTMLVTVIRIKASLGTTDTSVVLGQPLQLNATGGTSYTWLPDNRWLSSTIIPNPIALPQDNITYTVRVSDNNGCIGTASIIVRLYNLGAGLYVPNVFTPNGDGHNDVFKPIELGLKTLNLFRVYNRFGEMVYSTADMQQGWDGTYKGKAQDPGTYVWYGEGTDYTGKKVFRKGSVVLIR